MTVEPSPWISHEAIIELVGHDAFTRAMALVRGGQVSGVELDEETLVLTGRVRGSHRDGYAVTIQLATSRSGGMTAYRSRCSCPIVTDCKHAAAVLIVARQLGAASRVGRPVWQKTVEKLLEASAEPAPGDLADLALEFGVEQVPAFRDYPGRQDLRIRPARRGRSGSWVRSGISWDDLDFVSRSALPEHRELLLQFRAAAGNQARFALPRSAWLSLGAVSSGFWRLLAETTAAGLAVITAKPLVGPVVLDRAGRVELELSRSTDGLALRPRVLIGDEPVDETDDGTALGVIGEPAHGLFRLEQGDDDQRLSLIRLAGELSAELRQLMLDARPLIVPQADEDRFLADFGPALTRRPGLRVADPSIVVPTPARPVIELELGYEPDHRLRLHWGLRYGAGDAAVRFGVDEAPQPFGVRDPEAEEQGWRALRLPDDAYPQLAALGGRDRPAPRAVLDGIAAGTFVAEVVPGLIDAGVEITTSGAVVDYRRSVAEPAISVTTVPRRDRSDWFDLRVLVSIDGEQVPFDALFVALTTGEDHLILPTGVFFTLDRPEFVQLRTLIDEARAMQEPTEPELTVNRFQASVWDEWVDLGRVVDQTAGWQRRARSLSGAEAIAPVDPPRGLRAELRPYQLDGFRWLTYVHEQRLGGILADDMGLGKTVQVLALILRAHEERPDGPPFLVVAPTSVISTWRQEAERFAPGLGVVCLGDAGGPSRSIADRVAGADLVLTSYAQLRLRVDALADLPWSGLILDEAQFVKNHRSRTHQSVRRIGAPVTIALTGTPLENSLMDLWALLSLTSPGLFPYADRFAEYYRRPIERDGDRARLAQLRRRIRPLMLRRTKEAVATELPPKQEQVVEIELHPKHRRIYQTHLQRERQKVLGLVDDLETNRFTILRSLTLLRRLSLDPVLVDDAYEGVPAAKIDAVVDDLTELVAEGHQALVFSQFTSLLGRLRSRLDEVGVTTAYLDGQTRNRDRVIAGFRDRTAPVFLISLKAGGFGLNLTEADYCFVLDPWWNPAAEAQAVDRAHRIGQTRTVMVYRLVATGTIEQKVMELKARKSALFASVFGDEALATASLTAEDIRGLVS